MHLKHNYKTGVIIPGLIITLIIFGVASLCLGRYTITLSNFFDPQSMNIFFNLRMPRVLMSIVCGGALGIAGGIFQKVFKNDLASQDIIGVSSGASVGAICAIMLFGSIPVLVQTLSFAGGILAVSFAIIIASMNRHNYLFNLIIAGVIISSLCSSIVMFFKYLADPYNQLPTIEFWLMGGLQNSTFQNLLFVSIMCVVLFVTLYLLRWKMQVIALSDDEIKALGVRLMLWRVVFIVIATLLVSIVVSHCGIISWIGLIAPYIARLLSKHWTPLSFVIGAILLLSADTLARTLTPGEIPVGILVSFLGAPFLIYLLVKKGLGGYARNF